MSSAKVRENLSEQAERIRQQLRHNRQLIAYKMGSSEDVFPRSIVMQLITQQNMSDKMSDILPLYRMSLAGLRLYRFISSHSKEHKRLSSQG